MKLKLLLVAVQGVKFFIILNVFLMFYTTSNIENILQAAIYSSQPQSINRFYYFTRDETDQSTSESDEFSLYQFWSMTGRSNLMNYN